MSVRFLSQVLKIIVLKCLFAHQEFPVLISGISAMECRLAKPGFTVLVCLHSIPGFFVLMCLMAIFGLTVVQCLRILWHITVQCRDYLLCCVTTHPTPSLLGDNIEFLLVSRQTVGLALKVPLAGRQEEPVLCGIKLFNKTIVLVFSALHLHVESTWSTFIYFTFISKETSSMQSYIFVKSQTGYAVVVLAPSQY